MQIEIAIKTDFVGLLLFNVSSMDLLTFKVDPIF